MPKPTSIVNTSTVDNESGFVFISNVNFDFTSDCKEINKPKPSTPAMRISSTIKLYTAEDFLSFSLDKVRIDEVYRNKTEHKLSFMNNRF